MPVVATNYVGLMSLQSDFLQTIRRTPVSFALIAISALVFLLFWELDFVQLLYLLNFVSVQESAVGRLYGEPGDDLWRFVTPTLLHFGWMHIVFNALWVWEFGRRIEIRLGSIGVLGLYLASASVSNSVQYFVSGPSIFGGLSGVVYAFMGFIFVGNLVNPRWIEPVPFAVVIFMLIWLLIGAIGALEIMGVGAIANGAHFGGLIIGTILGGVLGSLARLSR